MNHEISRLRVQLREIDEKLFALFVERHAKLAEIAQVKKNDSLPIFDPQREEENRKFHQSKNHGQLSEEFIDGFSAFLAKWGRQIQEEYLSQLTKNDIKS